MESEHQIRMARILGQVITAGDKKWLMEKLAYSFEPSLRKRLKEIFAEHCKSVFSNLVKKPQAGKKAPRTHSQTLCFRGDFRSRGEDFDSFIKGSIFMINGKSTELGTCPADQPGLCLVVKGETYARDSRAINREVRSFCDTGLPVYPASQRKRWEGSYSGDGRCIYGETAAEPDQSGKEVCPISGDVDQQSSTGSAGRVPVKAGSWQKRRDKLKCRIATTGYGSKSSLRLTISLCQRPTIALSLLREVMLN